MKIFKRRKKVLKKYHPRSIEHAERNIQPRKNVANSFWSVSLIRYWKKVVFFICSLLPISRTHDSGSWNRGSNPRSAATPYFSVFPDVSRCKWGQVLLFACMSKGKKQDLTPIKKNWWFKPFWYSVAIPYFPRFSINFHTYLARREKSAILRYIACNITRILIMYCCIFSIFLDGFTTRGRYCGYIILKI